MSEVLSQQEIDELLNALRSGELNIDEIKEETQEKKVRVYDFRRPNKFAKDQLRTLQIIYENFSRLITSHLSGILRVYCQVDVVSVEPQTYYEFTNSLPDPVMLGIIDFKPLKGFMIMEFSPEIVYTIIDRLLGGPGKTVGKVRDFTEIEIVLLEKLIKDLTGLMNESWANVLKADIRLNRTETNAQFAQIVSPNETIAIITMNAQIGDVEGIINLCIPHMVLEPILPKLSTKYWFSGKMDEEDKKTQSGLIVRNIEDAKVEIKAVIGETTITVRDFLGLQQGDVIKLDRRIEEDIAIVIENHKKFCGIAGTKNKKMAVQITSKERGQSREL